MCFVNNDGKLPSSELLHILLGEEKLLDGADDNALFVVDGFRKTAGVLFVIDGLHQPHLMLKAVDGVLELAIQYHTIGDHDNGIKQAIVLCVVNGGQPIGNPGNGVGLAGTGGVLNQIVGAYTVLTHINHNLSHHIVLVVAGEDHLFFGDGFANTVLDHFLLFLHEGNEAVNEIQQAVTLQHFFPEVAGGVAVRILGIACTTCDTRTVGALIEGQKAGSTICQLGGHPRFIQINSKVDQETVVQAEG